MLRRPPCALGEPCGAATRAGCNAPAWPYTHLRTSTLSDAPLARPFSYGHMLTSQAGPAAAARSACSRKTMRTLRCAPHVPCAPGQRPGCAGLHPAARLSPDLQPAWRRPLAAAAAGTCVRQSASSARDRNPSLGLASSPAAAAPPAVLLAGPCSLGRQSSNDCSCCMHLHTQQSVL